MNVRARQITCPRRVGACGETGTDYLGIDEEACYFFTGGWYRKALDLARKFRDSFPEG